METSLTSPKNLSMYIEWRDDFLKIVSEDFCKECVDPHKNTKTINYESPLECECRCDRIKNVLTTAIKLDTEIKLLMNPKI